MPQEYFINSQELETKVRQLLPSQGGAGAGFDLCKHANYSDH